ncbi:alpha/beta-hydrolase family protein [Croceibacterium sp. LX-88]|uniref:Alpha/beta-hydrolase family protein n=1 Tax=Croceibacterium selenioxidans TaxID=2838833 RepID=A0ABS5W3X3_9SPHN|nr:alpha/beta-hydrolase family protein [Croceibacterium selenioxidans]MBT2134455.1 alpha/beta-hydrolase family protein [Croceibacterium selenioxidans]
MAGKFRVLPIRNWLAGRSLFGLAIGTLLFAASLTPSLTPRPPLLLGVLAGLGLAAGYVLGLALRGLWTYLGYAVQPAHPRGWQIIVGVLALIAVVFLWLSMGWQNDIRTLFGMEPWSRWNSITVALVSVITFGLLFLCGMGIRIVFRRSAKWLDRHFPRKVTVLLSALVAAVVLWAVVTGIVFRTGLHMMDSSFRELDALIEREAPAPTSTLKTGSTASLIAWDSLGRQGREYIASGPSIDDIAQLTGGPAQQPIRVYAGLNSADSVDQRARLALAELERVGGFDKSVLVVIAPTGTGWVDAAAIDTLEYLHRGDVASVAIQYSYLASWLSLLVEPNYGSDSARALFRQVYDHWKALPKESRPRLYLYGLSLGALSSESSMDLFDVIEDPIQGAVWAGPPFPSPLWNSATRNREPGSPVWLPRFRDGSIVRFTNQENQLNLPGARWGPMRIVYLQYGSDPITFFEPSSFYREPEWMRGQRAPDVSPSFVWIPGVTFTQLGVDMITGMSTPPGTGHVFAAEHYLDAWVAVTEPTGWTEDGLAKLRATLKTRQRAGS